MRTIIAQALLEAASAGAAELHLFTTMQHLGRTRFWGGNYRPRSKYMPHQGPKEIARRLRQAARLAEKRA